MKGAFSCHRSVAPTNLPVPLCLPWVAYSVTVSFIRCDSFGPIKWRSLTSVFFVCFFKLSLYRGQIEDCHHLEAISFEDSCVARCFIIAEGQIWLPIVNELQPYYDPSVAQVSKNLIAMYT